MIAAVCAQFGTLPSMVSDEVARSTLDVQRCLWSASVPLQRSSAFDALERLGECLTAEEREPFAKRLRRLESVSGGLLLTGFTLVGLLTFLVAILVALAPAWVLTGADMWPVARVVALAAGAVLVCIVLWLLASVYVEGALDRVDARLARLSHPERFRAIAWAHVNLDAVPASVLTDPSVRRECVFTHAGPASLLTDDLWLRFSGFDSQTVEMLSLESGLSVELACRAAAALG